MILTSGGNCNSGAGCIPFRMRLGFLTACIVLAASPVIAQRPATFPLIPWGTPLPTVKATVALDALSPDDSGSRFSAGITHLGKADPMGAHSQKAMHELSIAENILDIVRQYVPEHERGLLRKVRLRVGTNAGIVLDSLLFSFEAIVHDTPMATATLEIESVPYTIFCSGCGITSTPAEATAGCPVCGGIDTRVTSGTELQVVDLELDDPTGGTL